MINEYANDYSWKENDKKGMYSDRSSHINSLWLNVIRLVTFNQKGSQPTAIFPCDDVSNDEMNK